MRLLHILLSLLRALFWGTLFFALDKPHLAVFSLLALMLHEGAHILAFALFSEHATLDTRLHGLRLTPKRALSYKQERRIAAAGPIGGLTAMLISLLLSPLSPDYFLDFACINFLTSLLNLLPITGYDGYRILRATAALHEARWADKALSALSLFLTALLCLAFLCFLGVIGEGLFCAFVFLFTLIGALADEKIQK